MTLTNLALEWLSLFSSALPVLSSTNRNNSTTKKQKAVKKKYTQGMKKRREQSTRDAFSLQTSSKFFHADVGKITAPSQKGKKKKKI